MTVEINLGQIHLEVQRCAGGKAPAFLVGHAGGTVISPERIIETSSRQVSDESTDLDT